MVGGEVAGATNLLGFIYNFYLKLITTWNRTSIIIRESNISQYCVKVNTSVEKTPVIADKSCTAVQIGMQVSIKHDEFNFNFDEMQIDTKNGKHGRNMANIVRTAIKNAWKLKSWRFIPWLCDTLLSCCVKNAIVASAIFSIYLQRQQSDNSEYKPA